MVDINPITEIITLNVDDLDTLIKCIDCEKE